MTDLNLSAFFFLRVCFFPVISVDICPRRDSTVLSSARHGGPASLDSRFNPHRSMCTSSPGHFRWVLFHELLLLKRSVYRSAPVRLAQSFVFRTCAHRPSGAAVDCVQTCLGLPLRYGTPEMVTAPMTPICLRPLTTGPPRHGRILNLVHGATPCVW